MESRLLNIIIEYTINDHIFNDFILRIDNKMIIWLVLKTRKSAKLWTLDKLCKQWLASQLTFNLIAMIYSLIEKMFTNQMSFIQY